MGTGMDLGVVWRSIVRLRGLSALALAAVVAGCGPAILAGVGGVTGLGVMQERSTMDALRDNEIAISISNRLLNESGQLFRRVSLDVTEGRVLLTGGVETVEDKARAAEIAWATPGVTAVENEIVAEQQASTQRFAQDTWITSQVRTRLLTDAQVASRNYGIETHDGVVHLTGIARSSGELERAAAHAAAVPGVREVVSHVLSINDPRRTRPLPEARPAGAAS